MIVFNICVFINGYKGVNKGFNIISLKGLKFQSFCLQEPLKFKGKTKKIYFDFKSLSKVAENSQTKVKNDPLFRSTAEVQRTPGFEIHCMNACSVWKDGKGGV